jgi:hypothetical protein
LVAVLPGGRQTWRKPRDGPGGGTLATFVERTMSQGAVHGPCEIRHGERPGCATHPTQTKPNQGAAGQSPDISSNHPFGSAVRDEVVGVLEYSGAGVREVLPPLCPAGHLPLKGGDRYAARFRLSRSLRMSRGRASCRSPPLRGRCPAGQRGVSHTHLPPM